MRVTPGFFVSGRVPQKSLNSGCVDDIQHRGRADEGGKGAFGIAHQVVWATISHHASRLCNLVRICRPGAWPNRSGSHNHTSNTVVLLFCLVLGNRCPAGTVPNQYHLLKSGTFGEVNPGGDVSQLLTCHAPIAAAADPFSPPPPSDVAKVMHTRIARDAGIPALGEGPANPHVGRIVKIRTPSVDPDDGDALG